MGSKLFCLLGVAGISMSALASPLDALRPFQVYAVTNIRGAESDFEGAAGAGGDVSFNNFSLGSHLRFPLALSAGGAIAFQHASVEKGLTEAGAAYVQNAAIRGDLLCVGDFSGYHGSISGSLQHGGGIQLTRFDVARGAQQRSHLNLRTNHAALAQALYQASAEYAHLAQSGRVTREGTTLHLHGGSALQVFHVRKDSLQGVRNLRVTGAPGNTVIVNVTGEGELSLDSVDFSLEGGLRSENVLWNFPRITYLGLQRSGHDSQSALPGIQGTVLAPYALVNFREALLVGHLFVGSLDDSHGQVNEAPFFKDCRDEVSGGGGRHGCVGTPVAPKPANPAPIQVPSSPSGK